MSIINSIIGLKLNPNVTTNNPYTNTGINGTLGNSNPFKGVIINTDTQTETGTTDTGTGTTSQPTDTGQNVTTNPVTVLGEREAVVERVRQSADIDPAAKARIINLSKIRPELTAYDLRVIFATCLYPSAQGLPSPEGYEYFLRLIEKGETVQAALSDTRIYFNADAALTSPSDPTAPDSQDTLITQGRIVTYALIVFVILILVR